MKEKIQILPQFGLKLIAMLLMSVSHIGTFLLRYYGSNETGYTAGLVCYYIGRLAFPLFVLLTAEALRHTHSRKDYILQIAIAWALTTGGEGIAYLIDPDLLSGVGGNAFTDILCMASFVFFLEHPKKWVKPLALLPLTYVALSYAADLSELYADSYQMTSLWSASFLPFLRSGYSLYGFMMFLLVYYSKPLADRILGIGKERNEPDPLLGEQDDPLRRFKEGPTYQSLLNALAFGGVLIATLVFWALSYASIPDPYGMGVQSYCLLSGIFIAIYSGKRGYGSTWFKYSTYAYYPVHIILLWLSFRLAFGY